MEKYTCPRCELPCVIGNLFDQIEPPCSERNEGELVICGTTHSGKRGVLIIEKDTFRFEGDPEDLRFMREHSCPNRRDCTFSGGGGHG